MGDIQNLSRRAFIVGSAAVAGGVAFGSYGNAEQAATTANGNPLTAGLGPNSVTFNPWVEISPERITLIAQHADLGQGVGSVQPIMIAEEMDLDPGQFEIRFAGPGPAYFNTGFADELAPFLAADQSPAAEEARATELESLRVRLKTSARITKLSQHEADGGEFQEREGIAVEIFPVFGEAAATVEPGNRALDDPTLG